MTTRVASSTQPNGEPKDTGRPEKPERVRVFRPVIRVITVPIRGFAGVPLVENKMSEKALRQMADKQQARNIAPRKPKNPVECFHGAMHLMPGAKATDEHPDIGFPAGGFRKAMISAAHKDRNGVTKTQAKGGVFVLADEGDLVRIHYKSCAMREDPLPNANASLDIRYRPEFSDWWASVQVQYNEAMLTAEQVVNLMAWAGFSIGIGEARPDKGGSWGRWEVVSEEETA